MRFSNSQQLSLSTTSQPWAAEHVTHTSHASGCMHATWASLYVPHRLPSSQSKLKQDVKALHRLVGDFKENRVCMATTKSPKSPVFLHRGAAGGIAVILE